MKLDKQNKLIRIHFSLLSILVMIIILSVFTSAEVQTSLPVSQSNCASFTQLYANSTFQNISIVIRPDQSISSIMRSMTYLGEGAFNYTYCDANLIGRYIVSGIGDKDGVLTTWTYDYYVSPLAVQQSTAQAIGSAVYLFLMLALMFIFGYMGFRLMESNTVWIFGIFFVFLAVILIVYNVYLGYEYHRLFTGLADSQVPETIFYIFLSILVISFLASLILLFLKWKEVFRYIKRELKKKDNEDEDVEDWDVDNWSNQR